MILTKDYFEEFEMDLTGTCNLQCPLCTRNYVHAQHCSYIHIRPLEDIIKQLDTFTGLKRAFVAGQVSEPTLYPEFPDYLRYLKSRNMDVSLFTNGGLKRPEFWLEVGEILSDTDEVHFTICGSTQELHEKYRVGSRLQDILDNSKAYRSSGKTNDYCQFIEFEYNKHDYDEVRKFEFTNHYKVHSEGDRLFNKKLVQEDTGVRPVSNKDILIKWILDGRPKRGKSCIDCVSIKHKKVYISQEGKVYPCYMHCEYNPEDDFDFDYTDILDHKFDKCSLCDTRVRQKVEKMGLDFLC